MNAMLVYTASSCGVSASGIRLTAPTVPWMVSSSVSPVNTRIVSCFSPAVSVPHDGRSLDTGTFSGSQKLPVSRSQTSASLSSCSRFQLIAETRSISFILSVTRTPLHAPYLAADCSLCLDFKHYPWGATSWCNTRSCVSVSRTQPHPPSHSLSLPGITRSPRDWTEGSDAPCGRGSDRIANGSTVRGLRRHVRWGTEWGGGG